MSADQIRVWIYGVAAFALTVTSVHAAGGSAYVSTGAAAIAMIAAVLAVRSGFPANPHDQTGRVSDGRPIPVRVRSTGPRRVADPDAPGRARPRAPGSFPCE